MAQVVLGKNLHGDWQSNRESAAFAWQAVDYDRAMMSLEYLTGNA
jgi:hypothetical protein